MSLKDKKESFKVLKASLRQKDIEKKENLINMIISFPMLWDKSNSEYRDRNLQNLKWSEIAKHMDISVKEVKAMWKYLKDQFRVNFHAISKKKSGQEYVEEMDVNLVKWPFFRQLMFLKDVVTRRDTFSNIELAEKDEISDSQNEAEGGEVDKILNEIGNEIEEAAPSIQEQITENVDVSNYPEPTPSTSEDTLIGPSRKSTAKPLKKRVRGSQVVNIDDDIDNEINKVDKFIEASIAHKCEKNVEGRPERFCKYLAELLKLVDIDLQRRCEAEILDLVDQYIEKTKTAKKPRTTNVS